MNFLLRVVMKGALGELWRHLVAMLTRNVATYCVVACERAGAMRARHANSLMPLPNVRAQVRLVSVKSLAVWTF